MTEPERIDGMTLLMQACLEGNTKAVQAILQKQPSSVEEKDSFGKTPLHYTVENTHADCTSALLVANARLVNVQDGNGYAALHFAAMAGNTVVLERLMQATDVNIDIEDNEKHTPVHWATVCGHPKCIELLVHHNASAEIADVHGAFPLHYAAQMCGTEYEVPGIGMHCLSKLVQSGADVNCVDGSGRTPLLWAASAGSAEACLKLVQAGANPKSADKDGLTALHCAASRGHLQCCDVLISQCGCPVDSWDKNHCTPLFYAISFGHGTCTSLFLQQGASPNHQDIKGRSPAYCAAAKGQTSMVPILREHHGSLDIPTQDGETALLEAVKGGHTDMVKQLLAADCDVNAVSKSGRSALHEAAENNNLEMCRLIIDAGGKRNLLVRDGQGNSMTARELAEQNGHRELANYLRARGTAKSAKVKNQAARTVTGAVRKAGSIKRGQQEEEKRQREETKQREEEENRQLEEQKQMEEKQRREFEREEALREKAKELVETVILEALTEEEKKLEEQQKESENQSRTNANCEMETEEGEEDSKHNTEAKNKDGDEEQLVQPNEEETGLEGERAKGDTDNHCSNVEEQGDAKEEVLEASHPVDDKTTKPLGTASKHERTMYGADEDCCSSSEEEKSDSNEGEEKVDTNNDDKNVNSHEIASKGEKRTEESHEDLSSSNNEQTDGGEEDHNSISPTRKSDEKEEASEKDSVGDNQTTKGPEEAPNVVQTWDISSDFNNSTQSEDNQQEEMADAMGKIENEEEDKKSTVDDETTEGVDREMDFDKHRDNQEDYRLSTDRLSSPAESSSDSKKADSAKIGENDKEVNHQVQECDEINSGNQESKGAEQMTETPETEPSLQILQTILQDEDSEENQKTCSKEKKKVHIVTPTTTDRVDKTISAQKEVKWVRNVKIQANMDMKTRQKSAGIQCSFVHRPVSPDLVKGIQANPLFQDNVNVKDMVDSYYLQNRRRRLRPSSAPFPVALNRSVLVMSPRKSRLQEWKKDLDRRIPETVQEADSQQNGGMPFSALLQEEERILREVSSSTGPEQIEHLKSRLSYIQRLLQFNAEVTRMAKEEERRLTRELLDQERQQKQIKEREMRRQQMVEEEMKAMTDFFENLKSQISPGSGEASSQTSPRSAASREHSPPSRSNSSPRHREHSHTRFTEHSPRQMEHSKQTGKDCRDSYDEFYDGIVLPPQPSRASFTHRERSSRHNKRSQHRRHHPSPRRNEPSPQYRDPSPSHHREKTYSHSRGTSPQHRSRHRSSSSSPKPERGPSPPPSPRETPHNNYSYSSDSFDEDSSEEEDSISDTESVPSTPPVAKASSKDSPRRRGTQQAWDQPKEMPLLPRTPHPPPRRTTQREAAYRQKGYIYYPPIPRVESLDAHTAALYSHLHNSQHSLCLKLDKPLRPVGKAKDMLSSSRKNLKPSYVKLDYCNRAVEKQREGNLASSGYASEEPPRNEKPTPIKRPKTASNLIYSPRKRTIYPEEEELWNLPPGNRQTVISR
ncbi:PREDICTED: trichohyalin-like isoform X1 [Branchiostoma belcheri]|uniref:Trichohyalin-like isoform X1 n=1 Tax=Branchiostoma belcheri TaxID=7741 RepID=A0A6P4XPS3_BRABE|nr:PREDICTED: trichohyalin-like isoform X1 [Branchiostoma belcheri]XP_019618686.1 PREDICTED: trichohyalin-like isoform X1 [Branchiostoma belcheri]XP_019618687.1 PREDICTED: trichohyalin-like isoform X1 [Branchiostoma belcheri]XP_019618688.1 PREDICTED: trichohyalin-like isoform X1 [Branchiostoma belcheri]XP_019618689.1 PREDICTED: trichohyalin-like isoform X1 [Branchiostoma belcheri]XP_019618690.1 PREDICTED: trichohyalin-like isoform X1 [Branchiostoma belcheri]XP_019618692.1 PREDICTED: trichohya